jgi:hypothetical protein
MALSFRRSIRVLFVVLSVALAAGCNISPATQPAGEAAMVLRAYDLPSEYSAEIGGMIRRLLKPNGDDKPAIGSASVGPGGKLLVAAPDGIQEGVQQLVDALRTKQPPPPATVTIEVWVVAGRAAAEGRGLEALGEAKTAIEAVIGREGPMEVALLEKLSLSSISGQHASTFGANLKMSQVATVIDDRVLADISLDTVGPNELATRVELINGRMLVLGQAGFIPSNRSMPFFTEEPAAKSASLFYVVRAKTEPRGS